MAVRRTSTLLIVSVLGALVVSMVARGDGGNTLSGVLGGVMWDKWWVATGLPEPTGDHPLYPAVGQKSGSTTWRCKECHGWDYKGVNGAYGSGSHFTGIPGVFGSIMTREEMFDLIKFDTPPNGHGFGDTGLTDEEICNLVDFLQDFVIDTDSYIDGGNAFIGDVQQGRYNYSVAGGYYTCASCHGDDGTAINFGSPASPEYVGDLAVANPWEVMHKIRFGHPGTTMPSWMLGGGSNQGAADIGTYAQGDFPLPDFVGDQACSGCHANMPSVDFYDGYLRSGHPYKLFHSAGQQPPTNTWPFTDPPPLPVVLATQLEWSDVEYVIGNYFWKARFVDHDGYIYTGLADETTQWNLQTQEWVGYHAGDVDKPYNCGKCHTTGYDPNGNQLGLPGLIGTWTEEGVRCEACHGPAGDHVGNPLELKPSAGAKDCAECHFRDDQFRMPWKGGFTRHHQQAEDFSHSPHPAHMTCTTCHNPHRSTVYDDGGVITHCTDCHTGDAGNSFYSVAGMESVDCIECHMPDMGKSAVNVNEYKGDIRGHLFRITTDPIFAVDNVYEENGKLYWNQSAAGGAFATLDYACMGCHIEIGHPLTMPEASDFAWHLHTAHPAGSLVTFCPWDLNGDGSVVIADFLALLGAWGPNPGHPADFNGDGFVLIEDFLALLANWGACP